jgi:hypothetical protein
MIRNGHLWTAHHIETTNAGVGSSSGTVESAPGGMILSIIKQVQLLRHLINPVLFIQMSLTTTEIRIMRTLLLLLTVRDMH